MLLKFDEYCKNPPENDPQTCASVLICSNLLLTSLIALVSKQNVKKFPKTIAFDPLSITLS